MGWEMVVYWNLYNPLDPMVQYLSLISITLGLHCPFISSPGCKTNNSPSSSTKVQYVTILTFIHAPSQHGAQGKRLFGVLCIIIIIIIIIIPVSIVNITEINGLIDEKSVTIKTVYCTTFSKSFEDTMQYSVT
jgi:hypothetical protein